MLNDLKEDIFVYDKEVQTENIEVENVIIDDNIEKDKNEKINNNLHMIIDEIIINCNTNKKNKDFGYIHHEFIRLLLEQLNLLE